MRLSEITLYNFRSHESLEARFDPNLTLIVGENGTGKTNILEAIYVLCYGSSFRVSDGDLISYGHEDWKVKGVFETFDREVRYELSKRPAKQLIEKETTKRFTYRNRLPLVLFDPDDLLLIHGSPSRRRLALDTMIGTISHPYQQALRRYERILIQRNNLLKHSPRDLKDQLFVWDISLAEQAAQLCREREVFIIEINSHLSNIYSEISGKPQTLEIRYLPSLEQPFTNTNIISQLHGSLSRDIVRQTTGVGPHRDDFEFILNGVPAKTSASRGETRSSILALKLAYATQLQLVYATDPLLLFDDVFSELDPVRQENILKLSTKHQVIITHTRSLGHTHEIKL